jgi:putative SOS response-associated peptidase YedK
VHVAKAPGGATISVCNKPHPICDNELECNRYRPTYSKQYLAERFQATPHEIEERARYHIAPTQPVLIVRKEEGKKSRHFTTMRCGLIPSWAKERQNSTLLSFKIAPRER